MGVLRSREEALTTGLPRAETVESIVSYPALISENRVKGKFHDPC